MVKHNNVVPNGHFKKHWQNYVKTWFNQPARKTRRRVARQKKVVKNFPQPTTGPLHPIVHGTAVVRKSLLYPKQKTSSLVSASPPMLQL